MRKIAVLACVLIASNAYAQHFEASAHVAAAQWSEFDGNDIGAGGRFTFRPLPLIGIDADLTWYPSEFPPDTVAQFSAARVEGMFGATVGPKISRVRPFVKVAAGFLDVRASAKVFACIAIFPPPLACIMGGQTMAAYEIGGGVQVDAIGPAFIRADLTGRFLKYPGPTFGSDRQLHDEGFLGGAPRFTLGAGVRF